VTYAIDHVVLCCEPRAPEAAALARLGLTEGSDNVHAGQGTANRRFFFHNGFLELLWITDPDEAQNGPARRLRLWERWAGRRDPSVCPFGVVVRGEGQRAGEPPFEAWSYAPDYLPAGLEIQVASGTPLGEPELVFIQGTRRPDELAVEPLDHRLGVRCITHVHMHLPGPGPLSAAARAVVASGLVSFSHSRPFLMELVFDGAVKRESRRPSPALPLVLRW